MDVPVLADYEELTYNTEGSLEELSETMNVTDER